MTTVNDVPLLVKGHWSRSLLILELTHKMRQGQRMDNRTVFS